MQNDRFLMFILFFVVACTSKPAAIIEDDCSLKKYKKIDVAFAANETGETFDFDVAKTYTQYLILQLEQKGFVIATDIDKDKNVLLIKSNIPVYGTLVGH